MRFLISIFFTILILTSAIANDRIDLDLRLEPKEKNSFYLLKETFKNKKVIEIAGVRYVIVRSPNELFIDEYYDTSLHSLLEKNASLRYRKKFIDGSISKNLIQFKTQVDNSKKSGMKELKIEIDSEEEFISYDDFNNFINKTSNQNSTFYRELRNYINSSKLKRIFSVIDYRDRFYLRDDDKNTIFTISFDEAVYSKELIKKTYFVIEFEINEKIMASSKKIDSDVLVKSLNEFVYGLDKGNIFFNRTYDNKYEIGVKKLSAKPKTEALIEKYVIIFALFFIIILFSIPVFSRISSVLKGNNNSYIKSLKKDVE